jgi:hypothetical protein
MQTFKQLFEQSKKFIGYHNAEKKVADKIRREGFRIMKKVKRNRLYGNGVYFTNEPNERWGPEAIQVELRPRNALLDFGGEIVYEDNPLGLAVEAIGKTLFKTFHMSDAQKRAVAIEEYLRVKNIDMLLTDERHKTIYVVREPSIITILD